MTDSEAKRTEYMRAQMSLGERVEVLERQVDRLKDRKVAVEWASMTTDKIDDLARRVAEIELGLSASTPTGAHSCPMELARLRRIEEAARAVVKHFEGMFDSDSDEGCCEHVRMRLAEALDSEPKR